MDNVQMQAVRSQAWATRFGYLVAIVATLGCCLCMVSVWAIFSRDSLQTLQTSWYLRSNGEITSGTIVDLEEHSPGDHDTAAMYILVVEYEVGGKKYTVRSRDAYYVPDYNKGDIVQVIYDPNDPETAQVDIFYERWFEPILDASPF